MLLDESFGIVPVYRQENQNLFLLIQHHAGHWGFPKGHAEAGETAIEAACREFVEETSIRDYQLLGQTPIVESYSFVKKGETINKTVTYFVAVVQSIEVACQEAEIQNYAWAEFEQAMQLITFEQSRQILVKAQAQLQDKLTA